MRIKTISSQNVQKAISKTSILLGGVSGRRSVESCQTKKPKISPKYAALSSTEARLSALRFRRSEVLALMPLHFSDSCRQASAVSPNAIACVYPPLAQRKKSSICSALFGGVLSIPSYPTRIHLIPLHHPYLGHAAGGSVSFLQCQGAAHTGRCLQLAWLVVLGFFFVVHGGSVLRHGLGRKPEIFLIQGDRP